ncbi:hypothetical protein BC832DRAFT_589395 [Gaertneriomyces semiglobifer]|nr:hypothetical protein BC832DRAFT_589395 [Gaertneriomyces semiglobifer]
MMMLRLVQYCVALGLYLELANTVKATAPEDSPRAETLPFVPVWYPPPTIPFVPEVALPAGPTHARKVPPRPTPTARSTRAPTPAVTPTRSTSQTKTRDDELNLGTPTARLVPLPTATITSPTESPDFDFGNERDRDTSPPLLNDGSTGLICSSKVQILTVSIIAGVIGSSLMLTGDRL